MSQSTEEGGASAADGLALRQDAWVGKVVGVTVSRSTTTIGGHRAPPPPPPPWQSATPSDPAAKPLPQPRDLKLAEIDGALKTLEQAANAIGAPLGRTAVEPDIRRVKAGRELLANAADRGEIAKQLDAVPALLNEIEETRKAAVKDKADCESHAARLLEIDNALRQANEAADAIGKPLQRTAVDPAIRGALAKREALANAATRDELGRQLTAVPALLNEIEETRKAAVKDKADCESHAARLLEVNNALKIVETAAQDIGAPLLRTAIDPEINAVKLKAEALATAATREKIGEQVAAVPQLLVEIGEVAKQAAKDKADCVALGLKLKDVNDALQILTDTADLISAQIARDPVDPGIKKAQDARNDLAKAASRPEIGKQLAAVPQVLLDIESARQAAEQAEIEWQQLLARVADAESSVKATEGSLSWLDPGTQKSNLQGELGKVTKAIKDLASATTVQDYEVRLGKIELAAAACKGSANDAIALPYADQQLKQFAKWLPIFKKIADPNPVSKEFDALSLRKASAGSSGNPTSELIGTGNAAFAASTAAKKAYAVDQAAVRYLGEATKNVGSVTNPTFKGNLQTWIGEQNTNRTDAYKVASIAELTNKLDNVKWVADRLRAAIAGDAPMTQAVEKSLNEADTAIKQLPTGTSPRTELAKQYADLRKRLTDVGTISDYWDQQDELNALNRAALALVEEARTASFKAQAATTEGKKKIDELIKSFGNRIDDPVQQAVCKAAMQACYGVAIKIPEGMSCRTLPSIYEMMTLMPKGHFDGLKKIKYETDPLINTSYYGNNKVVLNQIGEGLGDDHTLTNQNNPTQEERVNYFNFTALHEFGHHVDDAVPVMKNNDKNPGFGQWKQETIDDVVAAVYTAAFAALTTVTPPPQPPPKPTTSGSTAKVPSQPPPPPPPTESDLKLLIRTLLETGKAKKPASASVSPLGTLFHAWDKIENQVGWKKCLAIRDSNTSPWNTPTEISTDRAYHEGYENDWYSYSISERKSGGISAYQFRSPVEWFAEQYAFYRLKSDKTKPTAIASYLSM